MDLAGRVALVTGATQAMGETIAVRVAELGATIVAVGRSHDRGAAVIERLRAAGHTAIFVATDVGSELEVEHAVRAADEAFGRIDIVVNNAAALDVTESALHLEPTSVFDSVVKVGLYGPFWLAKYAVPVMIREGRGGCFVNISSYASRRGVAGLPAYSASKGGLEALTRQMATDYAPHGIRANSLVLGSIAVPRNAAIHGDDESAGTLRAARMIERAGAPADVAAAVAFLASDAAAFVTGAAIPVDGGLLAKAPVFRAMHDRGGSST